MKLCVLWTLILLAVWSLPGLAGCQEGQQKPADKDAASSPQESGDDQSDEADQADEEGKVEEPTANDFMRQAAAIARDGDLDEAIELVEKARQLEPESPRIAMTFIGVLHARALELIEAGNRKDASPYFIRAAAFVRGLEGELKELIGPSSGPILYYEASSHALNGDSDKALAVLDEAFQMGFEDPESVRGDADFDSLRENTQFVALLEKHEKLIAERIATETAAELKEFESFPFDFQLKNLEGEEVKLADLKGKLVIVDFWGTWCPPCREEIPSFIKLKDAYGDQGLEIVGLTYEQEEDEAKAIETVKTFVEELKANYPFVMGDDATQEMVPALEGFPTTLFIDRAGKVRLQLTGYHRYAKLESVIKQLLEENAQ